MSGTVAINTLLDAESLAELRMWRQLKIVYWRCDVGVYEGVDVETGLTDFQFYVVPHDLMWDVISQL